MHEERKKENFTKDKKDTYMYNVHKIKIDVYFYKYG